MSVPSGISSDLSMSLSSVTQNNTKAGTGSTAERSFHTLRCTLTKAVSNFRSKSNANDAVVATTKQHSVEDVLSAVVTAQRKYEKKAESSKLRKHLSIISSRIMYYGQIMDVLAQYHPEYVSLAWGSMKFLFILVLNNEEMMTELAKEISKIVGVLPRAKLQFATFQTDLIRDLLGELQNTIAEYLIRALEWYSQSPGRHAWKAFTSPYKLRFLDLQRKIDEVARQIDNTATTQAHVKIVQMHKEIEDMRIMHQTTQELIRTQAGGMQNTQEVVDQMSRTMTEYHNIHLSRFAMFDRNLQEIQVGMMMAATKDVPLPSPLESLRFCQAVRRRRLDQNSLKFEALRPQLQHWAGRPESSLLLLEGSASTRSNIKDMATDLVEVIGSAKKTVLWSLRGRRSLESPEEAPIQLIKQLVHQLLQQNNPQVLGMISGSFNASRIQSASLESDWLDMLTLSMAGLQEVYLVIDLEILGTQNGTETARWPEFIEMMAKYCASMTNMLLKIVVVTFRQDVVRTIKTPSQHLDIVSLGKRPGQPMTGARAVTRKRRRLNQLLNFR